MFTQIQVNDITPLDTLKRMQTVRRGKFVYSNTFYQVNREMARWWNAVEQAKYAPECEALEMAA